MGLSQRTLMKLRNESLEVGGKVYEDDDNVLDEDVTHFDEDDDPLDNIGDLEDDDDRPVGEVPDEKEASN